MSGSKLTWFLCRGTELDLILQWRSNCFDFSGGVEINLIFFWIEFDFVFGLGLKLTGFVRGGRNWLCVDVFAAVVGVVVFFI